MLERRAKQNAPPKIYPTAIVVKGASIGRDVVIGAFCFVGKTARIGNGTRIQSHTSVWNGVTLEENVFVGPGAMFTNVKHPRAEYPRGPDWAETWVERGASIGAKSVLVAPVRVGTYAVIGAGAIVTKDVPAHAVVVGNPAKIVGFACVCGEIVSRGRRRPKNLHCGQCES